jgi:glycosyltransferase involved in cell wall biosynthesis
MPPKRILLVIPEMVVGGAAHSISRLSFELSREHTLFLVVFNRNNRVEFPHGGELLSLDVSPGNGFFGKLTAFGTRIKRLRKIKREKKIDVAISFLEGADYINILSRTNEKVIISIRGSKLHDEIMRDTLFFVRKNLLIPQLYNKADHIVAVNKGIVDELTHGFKVTRPGISVIHNFYDITRIMALSEVARSEALDEAYKGNVLVSTGRLSREKGIGPLIRMFAALKKSVDVRLVIVGDGPGMASLIQLSKDLSLKTAVEESREWDVYFTGVTDNVYKYLRGATAYVMNSSSEGFPNGLAEAMICGVPVVSSDCPYGPVEIMDRKSWSGWRDKPYFAESGILMPPIDTEEHLQMWVHTISSLIADKQLHNRLINAGITRVKDFERSVVIRQWLNLVSG